MLNRICLIGHVWEVPEVLDRADGFATAFSLAICAQQKKCEKPPHIITDWYRVVAEGELGQCCDKRLCCGDLVYVEGRVQAASISFQQNGQPSTIETRCQVIAESVMILSKTDKIQS